MMKVFAVSVCSSCLFIPLLTQAVDPDDCGGAACGSEHSNFDLMQVKQKIQVKHKGPTTPCHDSPPVWWSSTGASCYYYYWAKWCTSSGGYGSEWTYGKFSDWADKDGTDASQACCTCGGGSTETLSPTPAPPPTPAAPPTPADVCGEMDGPCKQCVVALDSACDWWFDFVCKQKCCETDACADVCAGTSECPACYDWPFPDVDPHASVHTWWKDSMGLTCGDYSHFNWCTNSGGYGGGWGIESWGTFADWADNRGIAADEACCMCGGGSPKWGLQDFDRCADDKKWHHVGNDHRNCDWIAEDPDKRCASSIRSPDGLKPWEGCPESCGLCDTPKPCVDDLSWHAAGDKTHDCGWVLQTMMINIHTCDLACSEGGKPVYAWQACPLSCGSCPWSPEAPTVSPKPPGPTAAPKVPTPAPTCGPPPDTTLTFLTVAVQAGATQIEVELDAIFGIGDDITIRWMPYLCETKTIVSFGTITVDSPLINSYPIGSEVWVTTYPAPTPDPTEAPPPVSTPVTKPIEPGDTEIEVEDEDGLSEGDDVTICSHDGKCETNTICGFGTIILCDACNDSYTNATLTRVAPTPAPTAVAPTPEPTESVATVMDDPHVRNIAGEVFDINMPGQHVMFRLPRDATQRPLIELRAVMSANAGTACGLYVRSVTFMGEWLDGQVVHVRAHQRNLPGNNNAGNATIWPFAMKVSPANAADADNWRPFENFKNAGVGAFEADFEMLTDKVTVGALRREEYGNFLEAQAFAFRFGPDKLPAKMATLIVAQASHQALGIELKKVSQLGWPAQEVGGLLGSDKRDRSIEEFTHECKEAKSKQMAGILRVSREQVVLKATW